MHPLATIPITAILVSTVAMAQAPGDPEGFHQDFDFIAAWGVDRGPDAAMALIPNDDCLPGDETGLCPRYEVGASLVSEGGVTPSFEASGLITDLALWALPDRLALWRGGLEDFRAPDGSTPFRGEAVIGDAYFAGRLTTPTGYDAFVTGIVTVVRFDFESPDRVSVGSVILEPLDEWEFAADGYQAIDELVASIWNDAASFEFSEHDPGDDDCFAKYLEAKRRCQANYSDCLEDADIDLENCLDDIGFWDRMIGAGVGAAAGGVAGAGIGAGIGSVVPGAGTVAAGTTGGFLGGFVGGVAGFFEGPAHAKDECYNDHKSQTKRCERRKSRCLDLAQEAFYKCLDG